MATKKVNKKNVFIMLGLFVLLLAYFLIFEANRKPEEKSKNYIFHFIQANVNQFEITTAKKVIAVERLANKWRITKPRELDASKMDVDAFLSDVKSLYIQKVIGKNLPNLEEYGLSAPKIVLKLWLGSGNKKEMLTLKVGNQNLDKSGYYAKLENSPEVLLLENFTESILDKDLFYFRDKDLCKIKANDIYGIKVKLNNENYELARKENKWNLLQPISKTNLTDEEINQIITPVADLRIKNFYDEDNKIDVSDTGLISPDITIDIFDKNKKSVKLFVGKETKDKDGYYVKRDGSEVVVSIDKKIVDDLKSNLTKLKEEGRGSKGNKGDKGDKDNKKKEK